MLDLHKELIVNAVSKDGKQISVTMSQECYQFICYNLIKLEVDYDAASRVTTLRDLTETKDKK